MLMKSKGKVLVVDDEIYIIHILDFSLSMEGYEVFSALDGQEAIEKAREVKPDLIVMDMIMPKMDGYVACKQIKTDPLTKHIPVILLSAKGRSINGKIAREVGAVEDVSKPFSPRKLIERVNAILELKK